MERGIPEEHVVKGVLMPSYQLTKQAETLMISPVAIKYFHVSIMCFLLKIQKHVLLCLTT